MIQVLTPVASQAVEVHSAPAVAGHSDRSFNAVLKSTVSRKSSAAHDDKSTVRPSSQVDTHRPDGIANKTRDTQAAQPSAGAQKTEQPRQDTQKDAQDDTQQTAQDILDQITAQMTAIVQPALNTPIVQDASKMFLLPVGQAGGMTPPLPVNNVLLQGNDADQQGSAIGTGFLGGVSPDAVAAAAKTAGDTKNSFMDMTEKSFQDQQANGSQNPADALKVKGAPDLSSVIGGNSDIASQKDDVFEKSLSQLKAAVSSDTQAGDTKSSKDAAGVYNQIVQVQAGSGHSSAPAQETIPVGRLSTAGEVISKAVSSGQKDIVLRLDPPDLGNVHIRLSYDNGILKADVRVDSGMVKDNFMNAMPQIKNALESVGIKASAFNVDVRDDQSRNGQGGNQQNNQQQRQNRGFRNAFSDFFA